MLYNKFVNIKDHLSPDDPCNHMLSRILNNFKLKENDDVVSDEDAEEDESEDQKEVPNKYFENN